MARTRREGVRQDVQIRRSEVVVVVPRPVDVLATVVRAATGMVVTMIMAMFVRVQDDDAHAVDGEADRGDENGVVDRDVGGVDQAVHAAGGHQRPRRRPAGRRR